MKKIIICGDSFSIDDADYPGIHWSYHLGKLLPDATIINLASSGASNLLIHLQIDQAISQQPDLIIVSFTSSLRATIKWQLTKNYTDILERFFVLHNKDPKADLTCFPYSSIDSFGILSSSQSQILKQYVTEFVDLDLMRLENYYIINDSLATLAHSGVNFIYSPGGFDHKNFIGSDQQLQFNQFKEYECPINLWDYDIRNHSIRPYYHVTDSTLHSKLADYYKCLIK